MTAKEYYRQTSDMAFALDNFTDDRNPDKIVANIVPSIAKNHQEAINILEENDFFSIPWEKFNEVNTDNLKFEIVFHYGVDDFDRFELNVCDVIDCTGSGGDVVLSCDGYRLIHEQRPQKTEDVKKTADKDVPAPVEHKSIFDLFDDIVGCSSCLDDLFNFPAFPKFPDITKIIEETRKNFANGIEKSKDDGNTKFYNFSCKIDPDGKVHIKRSSNDGTVEKEFKLGDSSSSSSSSNSQSRKIEIKDDNNLKTELKNLVK